MAKINPVTKIIWDEILGELRPPAGDGDCLAGGSGFFKYLNLKRGSVFRPKPLGSGGRPLSPGSVRLILGWRLLESPKAPSLLKKFYPCLKKSGEARFFGYYSLPTREDILLWEGKMRLAGNASRFRPPREKALTLGEISGLLKKSPFERYLLRKTGIYYQAILTR